MENFETKLSELLFNKANHTPKPKESLELLLKHVYDSVLVPAHGILKLQEEYALSTVSFDEEIRDDEDAFQDNAMAHLDVIRAGDEEAMLMYTLSFDFDENTGKTSFWSQVRAPYYEPELDAGQPAGAMAAAHTTGETSFEAVYFDSLDMKELVSQVQRDLFNSFEQFL